MKFLVYQYEQNQINSLVESDEEFNNAQGIAAAKAVRNTTEGCVLNGKICEANFITQ